jgi:hypothetical protein
MQRDSEHAAQGPRCSAGKDGLTGTANRRRLARDIFGVARIPRPNWNGACNDERPCRRLTVKDVFFFRESHVFFSGPASASSIGCSVCALRVPGVFSPPVEKKYGLCEGLRRFGTGGCVK